MQDQSLVDFLIGFVLGGLCGVILTLIVFQIVNTMVANKKVPKNTDPADYWKEGRSPYDDDEYDPQF